MRCFLSSPLRSHPAWPDRNEAMACAFEAMRRLRPLKIEMHWREVAKRDNVIWSPLLQGEWIRSGIERDGGVWPESEALGWCLWVLRHGGFSHLVLAQTIPRAKDYGRNGMDVERDEAKRLGLTVISDVDVLDLLRP